MMTENASSIYIPGGDTGILLIHGFTSTPKVFQGLCTLFSESGFTVSAPLLAGHGTHPKDLETTEWQDWYGSVEDGYELLSTHCTKIFVVGVSLGANLGCLLASNRKVAGLILIAIPYWIYKQKIIQIFYPVFRLLGMRYYRKSRRSAKIQGKEITSYTHIPLRCLPSFFHFIKNITDAAIIKVVSPTLVIQSKEDGVVKPRSAEYIFTKIQSTDKELYWIKNTHNNLHKGDSAQIISEKIKGFLSKYT